MVNVNYKVKTGPRKGDHKTFFGSYEEFGVWVVQNYKNIELKNIKYGGKEK